MLLFFLIWIIFGIIGLYINISKTPIQITCLGYIIALLICILIGPIAFLDSLGAAS